MKRKCKVEDSLGVACDKIMTEQEFKQDGMCSHCADHIWMEMVEAFPLDYFWTHN